MWNKLANSEGRAHQLASLSRMQMVSSPACILTSTRERVERARLGLVHHERGVHVMSKPRLQQAAALVLVLHQLRFRHLQTGICP